MGGATGMVDGTAIGCTVENDVDEVVLVGWLLVVVLLLLVLSLLWATPAGAVVWLILPPLLRRCFRFFFPPVLLDVLVVSPSSFSSRSLCSTPPLALCNPSLLAVFFILLLTLRSPLIPPPPRSLPSVVMALSEPKAELAALANRAERLVCWLRGGCGCSRRVSELALEVMLLLCALLLALLAVSSSCPRDSAALSRLAWYFVHMSISATALRTNDNDAERSGDTGGAGSGRGDTTLPARRTGEVSWSCSCSGWYGYSGDGERRVGGSAVDSE